MSKNRDFAALSQLAKSAINRNSARRKPASPAAGFHGVAANSVRARARKSAEQFSSAGSGNNNANNTARDDANGRLAHHKCKVLG